jgi:hypothetical protein
VSIEPLAEVAAKESSRIGDKLGYAKRVGMDLYQYLASFATQTQGDTIVIPTKALDRYGGCGCMMRNLQMYDCHSRRCSQPLRGMPANLQPRMHSQV